MKFDEKLVKEYQVWEGISLAEIELLESDKF
jgi:hypothetical protein